MLVAKYVMKVTKRSSIQNMTSSTYESRFRKTAYVICHEVGTTLYIVSVVIKEVYIRH
jgi:hypothetical protein